MQNEDMMKTMTTVSILGIIFLSGCATTPKEKRGDFIKPDTHYADLRNTLETDVEASWRGNFPI